MKRFFALVLVLTMVLQLVPTSVLAADNGGWKTLKSAPILRLADEGTTYLTVTFLDKDGGTVQSKYVQSGKSLGSTPAAPEVTGYTFQYWYWMDGETENRLDGTTVISQDLTVLPKYLASGSYHTVTFYDRDATVYKTVMVVTGEPIGSDYPVPHCP